MFYNNYRIILLQRNCSSTHETQYRYVLVLRMWNAWTDCGSKYWTISDTSPVILMLVTLRYIYMHGFFPLEVRESQFLQLIPESHHCMLNETYMLFFQISSSEFTFSFTRKWIVIVSYFPFPFVNSTFCFCDKNWISHWHTKIETKASCNDKSTKTYTIWFNKFPSS